MCASEIDERILKEAMQIARVKGFSDVNEFRWMGGFSGKRKKLTGPGWSVMSCQG